MQVLAIRDSLPHLRAVVLYGEEEPPPGEKGIISWNQLIKLGQATTDSILDTRLANIAINQVILLFFICLCFEPYMCVCMHSSR